MGSGFVRHVAHPPSPAGPDMNAALDLDNPEIPDAPPVQKLNYSHDAMIDMILTNPGISQNAIATAFGYSAAWVSRIMCSDAFRAALAKRRGEIVDPVVAERVRVNFDALVLRSQEILMEKLSKPPDEVSDSLATRVFELSTRAAGYGTKTQVSVEVDVNAHFAGLERNLTNMLRRNTDVVDGELEDTSEEKE